MGWSGSKRRNKLVWRIRIVEWTPPRKSRKILPRHWRIVKNLLRRNRSSKTSKNWWFVFASREESYDCESIVDSNSGSTEPRKFLVRSARMFTILRQLAALERPTFPVNPLLFRVPGLCLVAILDCRLIHGILWYFRKRFERLPAREGRTTTFLQQLKEFGIIVLRIETWFWRKYKEAGEWNETRTTKFVNTCTTLPKRSWNVRSYWWNLFSQWCGRWSEISAFRHCIWENFLTLWNFKAGNSTSELRFVQEEPILISQCAGIKEVGTAKSIEELLTSRSIVGRIDFPDFDMLDAKIVPALKRLLDKHAHFR